LHKKSLFYNFIAININFITMKKDQEAFLGMALKVRNFGIKKKDALMVIAVVLGYFDLLNEKIVQLIKADTGGRADLTGYALMKSKKRQVLENFALKVSNAVATYAVVKDDSVLLKKADYPTSKWYLVSEEELITYATSVKNLAEPLAADIEPYGANAADVSKLSDCINDFTNVISDPSLAIDQRKEDNASVGDIIDDIRTLFTTKLDIVMRSFEANNASLYDLYKSARAIDVNGSVEEPTLVKEVDGGGKISTLYKAESYSADTFYTIQNKGNAEVEFGLATADEQEADSWVKLGAGETRSRLASNLSETGTYLVVKNDNAGKINIRLWVE